MPELTIPEAAFAADDPGMNRWGHQYRGCHALSEGQRQNIAAPLYRQMSCLQRAISCRRGQTSGRGGRQYFLFPCPMCVRMLGAFRGGAPHA